MLTSQTQTVVSSPASLIQILCGPTGNEYRERETLSHSSRANTDHYMTVQPKQAKEYNGKGSIVTFHTLAEHGKHGLRVCGHFQQGPAVREPN